MLVETLAAKLGQKTLRSICSDYIAVLCRPPHWKERTNMAKKAKRAKRREWTKENVRELKAHSCSRTPVAEISKLTKRTVAALCVKAIRMGMPLGHRR
jgi:hypothetical protein